MSDYYWTLPVLGVVGLLFAGLIYASIKKVKVSNQKMVEISDAIHDGAMVFLQREYGILLLFIVLAFGLLSWAVSVWTAVAFVLGAASSMMAGFFGLKAATRANVRTTQAAHDSGIAEALNIAFSGGAVMGLSVASLGLMGVSIAFMLGRRGSIEFSDISGFAMGGQFHRPLCPRRGRDLHKDGRCRSRPGRKGRGGNSRGRSKEPGHHRRQRGRLCGGHSRHGS